MVAVRKGGCMKNWGSQIWVKVFKDMGWEIDKDIRNRSVLPYLKFYLGLLFAFHHQYHRIFLPHLLFLSFLRAYYLSFCRSSIPSIPLLFSIFFLDDEKWCEISSVSWATTNLIVAIKPCNTQVSSTATWSTFIPLCKYQWVFHH